MIFGTRYTCLHCPDYDLCFKCYPRAGLHGGDHSFKKREMSDHEEAADAVEVRKFLRSIEETEGGGGSQGRGQPSPLSNDSDDSSSGP
ncbi:hypothetical protein IQ07DRAFT_549144 [Pyrenochaeta sp. DS3sAY3a]|nr:hypothetical protein IQ07DRAFT_549144 [Pyrenochaeta sp. DS3sAY3a]